MQQGPPQQYAQQYYHRPPEGYGREGGQMVYGQSPYASQQYAYQYPHGQYPAAGRPPQGPEMAVASGPPGGQPYGHMSSQGSQSHEQRQRLSQSQQMQKPPPRHGVPPHLQHQQQTMQQHHQAQHDVSSSRTGPQGQPYMEHPGHPYNRAQPSGYPVDKYLQGGAAMMDGIQMQQDVNGDSKILGQSTGVPSEWPPPLRQWVERSFEQCTNEIVKDEMEIALRTIILESFFANELNRDWDLCPLPAVPTGKPGGALKRTISQQPHPGPASPTQKQPKRLKVDPSASEEQRKAQREKLYNTKSKKDTAWRLPAASPNDEAGNPVVIEGKCENLEKPYRNLKDKNPDPYEVRPVRVLKQTLKMLKQKWETDHDYQYVIEQFKSARQDMMIQGVQTEFTVEVYETNARICLQKDDLTEFTKCQSQLQQLYAEGIPGCENEFLSYRLLHAVLTNVRSSVASIMEKLTPEQQRNRAVKHAVDVAKALSNKSCLNYVHFFKLCQNPPNMSGYILQMMVQAQRFHALKVITKAYKNFIEVGFVKKQLGFASKEECIEFLKQYQTVFEESEDGNVSELRIDTTETFNILHSQPQ